ncbi:hypothetical protein ACFRR7_14750 [Streptomyces sp. NPDC056909]|uniref:hypothetical protein n=1 Tax=Streptomyces sp. NPDC056909 TaxID=3345963 RepID=UPI0036CBAEB8
MARFFVETPAVARLLVVARAARRRRLRGVSRLPTLATSPTNAIVPMTATTKIPRPVIDPTVLLFPRGGALRAPSRGRLRGDRLSSVPSCPHPVPSSRRRFVTSPLGRFVASSLRP